MRWCLRDVLVLHDANFCDSTLLEIDTKLDETKHDGLQGLNKSLLESPRREDLVQAGKRRLPLTAIE